MWSTTPSHGDRGHASVCWLASSPGSSLLAASISRLGGDRWDGELRIFNLAQNNNRDPTLETTGAIALAETGSSCCAWTRDGREVVVGCDDGTIRMMSFSSAENSWIQACSSADSPPASNQRFARVHNVDVTTVAPSRWDSSKIVSGSSDGELCLYEVNESSMTPTWWGTPYDHLDLIKVVAAEWTTPNTLAALSDDGAFSTLDVRSSGGLESTSLSLDNKGVLVSSISFAGEYEFIVGTSDGSLGWLDLRSLTSTSSAKPYFRAFEGDRVSTRGPVRCVASATSPSSNHAERFILSGSDDGSVHCTRVTSTDSSTMFERRAHADFAKAVAFVGEPATPVSGGYDGRITAHSELIVL